MVLETDQHKLLTVMKQNYAILSKTHDAIGSSPFMIQGCNKVIHSMCNSIEIVLDDNKNIIMLISLIKKLDHINIKIILPSDKINNDLLHPECHCAILNDTVLSNALTSHEKGLHSSFFLDYKLCRLGKAIHMPIFPLLDIDCPVCHMRKINKTIHR